jgi:hypothetical protein
MFVFGRMETNQRVAAVRVHVAHGQATSEKGLEQKGSGFVNGQTRPVIIASELVTEKS